THVTAGDGSRPPYRCRPGHGGSGAGAAGALPGVGRPARWCCPRAGPAAAGGPRGRGRRRRGCARTDCRTAPDAAGRTAVTPAAHLAAERRAERARGSRPVGDRNPRPLSPVGRTRPVHDAHLPAHHLSQSRRRLVEGDHVTDPADRNIRVRGHQLTWTGAGETVVVEPWGRNSVRVRATMRGEVLDTDWALLAPEPADHTEVSIEVHDRGATLRNGAIRVELETTSWFHEPVGYDVFLSTLAFYDADDRLLLRELGRGGSLDLRARHFRAHQGGDGHALTASFETDPAEHLAGMGQYQQHVLDLKGSTFELAHRNSQASVPFVVSTAGYGFLWHNPAIGR